MVDPSMSESLTDKRRALLLEVSQFLLRDRESMVGVQYDTATDLAHRAAQLSMTGGGAGDRFESVSASRDLDIPVTRDGLTIHMPAATPQEVVTALFSIAIVVCATPRDSITLAGIVACVVAECEVVRDGYRSHSVALHQVFAALRGETDIPSDPYPDGAGVAKVIYRARVAIESMRATATALGQISGPPRTVGQEDA